MAPQLSAPPIQTFFLSVLDQNKALYIFHKKGQCLIARNLKALD